jgi:fumarate reductase flavoprotein subunit
MATQAFDVIVVGGGGAGLAAAIEAAESHARVLLLEKNDQLGGSTAWSIGSVTATQTEHQRRRGIVDTPAAHWLDMPGFAGELKPRDNDALRRILCDAMPQTFQWLLDSGVCFYGPMPEPPHSQPRMHNVLPNSRAFIYHLERRARKAGVEIRLGARVTALDVNDAARVCGVVVGTEQRRTHIEATGDVVLAAGDFTNDPSLKARFMGEQAAKVDGVNPTATGDGQRLAEALGAQIVNGDLALGPELRFIAPAHESFVRRLPPWRPLALAMQWSLEHVPMALLRPFMMKFLTTMLAPTPALFDDGARLVNQRGERFGDEREQPAWRLPDQPDKVGWIVIDARIARRYQAWPHFISTAPGIAYAYLDDYRRNRSDVFTEAAALPALAARLGMAADSLQRACGVLDGDRPALVEPPFIALGPLRSVFVHAEGGLGVDEQHRVLGARGSPIDGLRAAGSTGQGGLLLKGHGHHLAWAFASGRRAGRFAAEAARARQSTA